MSFDRVAPHYRWLETLAFGRQLQQARLAFVREVGSPRRVLIVGEGNGRFLAEFVSVHPGAAIDCIEASARMITRARPKAGAAPVTFHQANVLALRLAENSYDLIVTHFVLDCFAEETLARLIPQLAGAATANACWLIAEFCLPARGWRRWRAQALIALMYLFFRTVAGIEARRLVDYHSLLRGQSFGLTTEQTSRHGEIRSQLWRRGLTASTPPREPDHEPAE